MSDRELLELAAKAARMRLTSNGVRDLGDWEWLQAGDKNWGLFANNANGTQRKWNPLTDDGDALRLAVKLRMSVESWGAGASAVALINNRASVAEPHYGDDPERATRRAIVRAAAEIGKAAS